MQNLINQIKEYFNIDNIWTYLISHLWSVVLALIIIIFYGKIRKGILDLFKKFLKRISKNNLGLYSFFKSIITISIDIALIFIIVSLLGIKFAGMLALISAISLVLGFAFKEILSNVFGGVILLIFKPFKVGDVISYNGFIGTVRKIEIYYTTLTNFQNEEVIIPNGNLINSEVRNINKNNHRRLDIQVGVGYSSNIPQVKQLINDIIVKRKDDLFFIEEVQPIIGMYNIGASTLDMDIRVYVRENQYLNARYYLFESIKSTFDQYNIELPYNIIDLQVNQGYNKIKISDITNRE